MFPIEQKKLQVFGFQHQRLKGKPQISKKLEQNWPFNVYFFEQFS